MGRHRRSAAGRAATSRATGVTQTHGSYSGSHDPQDSYAGDRATMGIAPYLNPEAYADANARSSAYLYAMEDGFAPVTDTAVFPADGFSPAGAPRERGHRRKKKAATPVRTGLLGVSAAVAIGTVAVATGAVPGLDNYKLGGTTSTSGGDKVQAAGAPSNTAAEQGGTSGSADNGRGGGSGGAAGTSTSRGADRSASPTPSASASASPTPTKPPSAEPTATTPSTKPKGKPENKEPKAPPKKSSPVTISASAAAEAQVLKLVNEERAKVGCSPVSANSSLSKLAEAFSDDMAARGFFDHTDPDGATPWDRADKAGITGLGGENIARGQTDAAAVMEAWMNSPGHRANILNCDFKTLGVGVHIGSGGPWWTQDFGY
ncbi:CAP domain-containing protein [Streptomyces sp. NPDC047082]|uniref:CAP domain-containing protein n=1 Tax=Streptomyces sp. NPDC047082 TaxID=3155259 RepID=UPI00340CCDB5